MNWIIETERLQLRESTAALDAKSAFLLNKDPEVIRYTGDPPFESIQAAYEFLDAYTDYTRNGYGRWAVITKQDQAYIGWCGLKKHDSGMVDLGFRFNRQAWGKGFATEAAQACIQYGFNVLHLPEIVGRVARANTASIRVLEKCNFQFWKTDECNGIEDSLYYKLKA